MNLEGELLTLNEAAVVAEVSVRNLNRVIDERILPDHFVSVAEGRRRVRSDGCGYVRFYFGMAERLTADARANVIYAFSHDQLTAPGSWVYKDDVLTLNVGRFFKETRARHDKLRRARERVVEDPAILGGTPTIKGTRIGVHDVAAAVAAGSTAERLRAAYPGLSDEDVELAVLYAEANPPRGRPRRPVILPPGTSPTLELTVPRPRRG